MRAARVLLLAALLGLGIGSGCGWRLGQPRAPLAARPTVAPRPLDHVATPTPAPLDDRPAPVTEDRPPSAPAPTAWAVPTAQPPPPFGPAPASTLEPTQTAPPTPEPTATPPDLADLLDGVAPNPDAGYALVVQDVASGARLGWNDQQVLPAASLYKLGLAWAVFEAADDGRLDLDAPLEIVDDDAREAEPAGGFAPGQTPTAREALAGMLSVSSNAAAHAFLRVLGRHAFNASMAQLGLADTRVPEDPADVDPDDPSAPDNPTQAVTSADDVARLLTLLASGQGLSASACDEFWQLLASGALPDPLRETLPDGVEVFDKTGNLPDASNVGALLRSPRGLVVLVVIDHGVHPGDARDMIARLGQAVYDGLLQPAE